jgi:hypothetical protein
MEPGRFERGPDGWTIEVHGHNCMAPDLVGFCYVDVLIRYAGREVENSDVIRLVGGLFSKPRVDDNGDCSDAVTLAAHFGTEPDKSGELPASRSLGYQIAEPREDAIDASLLRETRALIKKLRSQSEEKRLAGDQTEADRLRQEADEADRFMRRDLNASGRARSLRTNNDRSRESVGAAVRRAIKAVAKLEPAIGAYLRDNVSLGVSGSIFLDTSIDWQLSPWFVASPSTEFVSIDPHKVAELIAERRLRAGSSSPALEEWEADDFEDV